MSDTCFRRLAAAVTVALTTATGAFAQDRPSEFEGWTLPGWTFTPGISFSTQWDSNVALAGRSPEGRTESDTVFLWAPFAQVSMNGSRTEFSAGYRGYLRRYVEVEAFNGYDQRAYASLRHRLTPRLAIYAQNEYSSAPTTDLVELNGVPFARAGTRSNRVSASLEARLTRYTDMSVTYDNSWTAFDAVEEFLRGGTIHTGSFDLTRRLSERLAVGGEARIRRSNVTRQDPRVLWFQDFGGTVSYQLLPRTSISAAAGLSRLQDSRFDDSRQDPYFRIDLEHETERATMGVGFEKSYTPAYSFSGSNNNRELRGFVRMPFSRNRLYVQSSVTWRRGVPFFAEEIQLDTFLTDATIGYSTTRWLRIEGYYGFSLQDSIITGGEVDRHRVGAQIVISQPMRIH